MLVGIETGGTKVVAALATESEPQKILSKLQIPTVEPRDVFAQIDEFITQNLKPGESITSVGIGAFGPVNVDPALPDYGMVTNTPKPGWKGFHLVGALRQAPAVPTAVVTDVTGAAMGEAATGAGQGIRSLGYMTVGTGVGIGVLSAGSPIQGNGYPELGHIMVRRHPQDTEFGGVCPFHNDCLEGLAAGPAVRARWGAQTSEFAPETLAERSDILAYYIAQGIVTVCYAFGIQRMVLGGGVSKTVGMHQRVADWAVELKGGAGDTGYGAPLAAEFVVPTGLGDESGVLGALQLAADNLK